MYVTSMIYYKKYFLQQQIKSNRPNENILFRASLRVLFLWSGCKGNKMDKDQIIQEMRQVGATWQEIADRLGYDNGEKVRCYARNQSWYKDLNKHKSRHDKIQPAQYTNDKISKQITLSDGSISSTIRQKLLEQKTFTNDELLEIHGFDINEFEIKAVTSNEWSMTNGAGEKYYNFQSKIIAQPISKENRLLQSLEELISKHTKTYTFENVKTNVRNESIILPLPDLHFGPNSFEDYKKYQDEIIQILDKGFKTVLIISLGDQINTDNFIHTTVSGTRVNDTNIPLAWDYSSMFFEPIIQKSLQVSDDVRFVYNRGNHDESISWAFTKYLEVKYPQIKMENTLDQLKVEVIDKVAIYTSHGHKRNNKLTSLCSTLYPQAWGCTETRILLTGHYHYLKSNDEMGITHYQLPTISGDTEYEKDNLYLGSKKLIHIFFIDNKDIKGIRYI